MIHSSTATVKLVKVSGGQMLPLKHSPPPSEEKALQKGFFWHIPFPFPFQAGREICRATKREKHLYSTLGTS